MQPLFAKTEAKLSLRQKYRSTQEVHIHRDLGHKAKPNSPVPAETPFLHDRLIGIRPLKRCPQQMNTMCLPDRPQEKIESAFLPTKYIHSESKELAIPNAQPKYQE